MIKTTPSTTPSHSDDALHYAQCVVNGDIPACKWVVLACQRHLSDLTRAESAAFPYRFDTEKANRVCRFLELLPHVSGKWAAKNELMVLQPWQRFITCSIFGWVKKATDKRRFRIAYICIPRKNGKSFWTAGIGLYGLIMDNEYGAQIYAGASTEKQAYMVFSPAKEMAKRVPVLAERFGVEVNAKSITVAKTNSKFEPLIGKPGDGGSPSIALIDEMHEHQDSTLYDTMVTGMGAREQPLALVITTAGFDTNGPCYLMQSDMERMLTGVVENDDWFSIIYTIDPEDEWTTEDALKKANPNWGVSVMPDAILSAQREAIISAEKQSTFKTKHLNVWCSARASFFNLEKWMKDCYEDGLTEKDFEGQPCVIGLDLASQVDLSAYVKIFRKGAIADRETYYVFPRIYAPDYTVHLPENQHYQKWADAGELTVTEGNEIDLPTIRKHLLDDIAKYDVRLLAFDKWQATFMKQLIQSETSVDTDEIPQQAAYLSDPMKWLDAMMRSGRVKHNGNQLMSWMIGNVVAKEDGNELVFPRKERPEKKIDGVSALLNGLVHIRTMLDGKSKLFRYNGI